MLVDLKLTFLILPTYSFHGRKTFRLGSQNRDVREERCSKEGEEIFETEYQLESSN